MPFSLITQFKYSQYRPWWWWYWCMHTEGFLYLRGTWRRKICKGEQISIGFSGSCYIKNVWGACTIKRHKSYWRKCQYISSWWQRSLEPIFWLEIDWKGYLYSKLLCDLSFSLTSPKCLYDIKENNPQQHLY